VGTQSDACADGWLALRRSDWAGARASFEAALAAADAPDAYEGLSWAAWWLDDAATVFSARESAYRLYRKTGDRTSAARMATWLAADELDFRGSPAVAVGWLRRASRLLEPLEPGPDHGWLAFHEGYVAYASGDPRTARRRATTAAELGRSFAVPDLEMLGLALEGSALVACARVAEGMRCLDEATATALEGEATIPISSAWACCFLVTACTALLDLERAGPWCDRIADFAARHGSRYMLAFCRAEYGTVAMWRGSWDEAESLLEAAVADYSHSRPAWVGAPLAVLAELRRRQGRADEAARLLERAGGRRALLGRARLALDRGDAVRAAELAKRVLRDTADERALDRAPALDVLAHAQVTRGELDAAAPTIAALRGLAGEVGTAAYRATVDLVEGKLAAARADHERARTLLEDAVDGFERSSMSFEAGRARMELATLLATTGRTADATAELERTRDRLAALGADAESARARRLLDAYARGRGVAPLTRREREVLALVADGLTNRQIAERLVVSEHTVHRHVTNILRKLDLPSRTAAAAYAARRGLLDASSR
jgi:DNA-binding NarL/FixJ family response regulator